jgi:DNA modification methylase
MRRGVVVAAVGTEANEYVLHHGDARSLPIGGEEVQSVVTSPPYFGLRSDSEIGRASLPEYIAVLVEVFREVRRVLAKDGVVWLNLGDTFASASSGSHGLSGGVDKSTLKSQPRLGTVPRKRVIPEGLKPKDLIGVPWRVAFALQDDGWWLRQAVVWHNVNALPDAASDRPTSDYEMMFMLTRSASYFYDAAAVKQDALWERWGRQTVPKYEGTETASGWMREREDFDALRNEGKNLRSVWPIPHAQYPGEHEAVMPVELASLCIASSTRLGDLVLDPFAGTATTLLAALRLGRRAVGVEINPDYIELARTRLTKWWVTEPQLVVRRDHPTLWDE